MRRFGSIVTTVFALAVVTTACAVDRHEVRYDGYFDAKAQDAIKREWVPEWLPEESTDIREAHAGDSGNAILRAAWPQGADLPDHCVEVDVPPTPRLGADWFPEDVVGLAAAAVCEDDGYVVVDDDVLYRWTVATRSSDDGDQASLPSGS